MYIKCSDVTDKLFNTEYKSGMGFIDKKSQAGRSTVNSLCDFPLKRTWPGLDGKWNDMLLMQPSLLKSYTINFT